MRTLIQLILIGLLIMCFSRCKTAEQMAQKALDKNEIKAGEIFRKRFPCIDGVVRPGDSTGYFKLLDSLKFIDGYFNDLLNNIEPERIIEKDMSDSAKAATCADNYNNLKKSYNILKEKNDKLSAAISRPVFIHDTVPVKDSFDIKALLVKVGNLQADTAQLRASRDEWMGKAKHRATENWIWRAIATVLIFIFAIRLWKRLTTIKLRA